MVVFLVGILLLVGVWVGAVVLWLKSDAEQSKKSSSSESAWVSRRFSAGVIGG